MISPGSGASLDFCHVSLGVELVYVYGNVAPAILNPNDISDVWETPVNLTPNQRAPLWIYRVVK